MKTLLFNLFTLFFAGHLFAADIVANFSAANKLYAEGKFPAAAAAYGQILQTGQSSALLFNYANAEFKTGNLGSAIAGYRRAARLSPHDAEIRANLAFVRNQVQGSTLRENGWQGWLGQLSLNEWTGFTGLAFWLTFILLAVSQFKPTLGARLRPAIRAVALLTILFGIILGLQATDHFSRQTAVVTADGAVARSGPFDEAQNAFTLHDGAELPVLDRHENWVQVAASSGKTGWLPVKQVVVLPGA